MIAHGIVRSRQSHLIEGKDIATDFAFRIIEWLPVPGGAIAGDTSVTVRQPGGTVVVDGRAIRAIDNEFPMLTSQLR